jgi:16S rRNA (guanine1516-N2)-methyltransferase
MKKISIAVSFKEPEFEKKAEQLALALGLPFAKKVESFDYFLMLSRKHLAIESTKDKKFTPFYIDFLSKKMLYRSQHASRRNELLVKAIHLPRTPHHIESSREPTIIDATAGLGRDSFILASLGFEVIMLERSAILHALLQNALLRAEKDEKLAPIVHRLHLIHTDACIWLKENPLKPLVIYLDPMFPERKKTALVKKEMILLQNLLGNDKDAEKLLELALTCATRRVVVKRPRLAPYLSARAPHFSIQGKSSRFDIYLPK